MKKRKRHYPIHELPPEAPDLTPDLPPDPPPGPAPNADAPGETPAQDLSPTPAPAEARPDGGAEAHDSEAPTQVDLDQQVAGPPAEPAAAVATLEQQYADLESKYLRAAADLQNYARRARQNIVDARQQQLMDVARALVVVLDHFDHALEVDLEKTSPQALLQGVQIVRDELLGALEKFGVRRLEVKPGDEFDPNQHEAMMQQAVEGVGPNRVAAQFQPGYTLQDKTLRPAKVSVTE